MNKAMQLTQDIVGDVFRGARLAVQINWDIRVTKAQLTNKRTQIFNRASDILRRIDIKLFIINRQDKGACAALLLCK